MYDIEEMLKKRPVVIENKQGIPEVIPLDYAEKLVKDGRAEEITETIYKPDENDIARDVGCIVVRYKRK